MGNYDIFFNYSDPTHNLYDPFQYTITWTKSASDNFKNYTYRSGHGLTKNDLNIIKLTCIIIIDKV